MVVPGPLESLANMQHVNHELQLLLDLQWCTSMTGIMLPYSNCSAIISPKLLNL